MFLFIYLNYANKPKIRNIFLYTDHAKINYYINVRNNNIKVLI